MRRPSAVMTGSGNGAIVIALMGSIWMWIALRNHILPLVISLLAPLLLILWGIKFVRAGSRFRKEEEPPTATESAAANALKRRFMWVFAGEGVAIFIAVNVLANIDQSILLFPTIGVIVGVHFLPLAQLYGRSLFYWSGAVQISLCVLLAIGLRSNPGALNTATGLSMAVVLWTTMFVQLFRSRDAFYCADSARSLA